MILIDSVYTNQSGSKRLLEYFIRYLFEIGRLQDCFFVFDERIQSDTITMVSEEKCTFLKPTEIERKKFYTKLTPDVQSVFCFGSVPPPIIIKDRQVVILQHNPFFFETPGYSIHLKIIYLIKRIYIWSRCYHKYYWVVQTPRLKEILVNLLRIYPEQIAVKPFYEQNYFRKTDTKTISQPLKFVYPADGVPQKNHIFLFKVWEQLYQKNNLKPELHITLPEHYTNHIKAVRRLKGMGVQIFNHGLISKSEVKMLYENSHFLVFPSLSESFGLPLVEAAEAGLKVIASDLPYLYQVVEPSAVFNPKDEKSLVNLIISIHQKGLVKNTNILIRNNISDLVEMLIPVKQ